MGKPGSCEFDRGFLSFLRPAFNLGGRVLDAHGHTKLPPNQWPLGSSLENEEWNSWTRKVEFWKVLSQVLEGKLKEKRKYSSWTESGVTWSGVPFRVLILAFIRLCWVFAGVRRNWSVQLARSQASRCLSVSVTPSDMVSRKGDHSEEDDWKPKLPPNTPGLWGGRTKAFWAQHFWHLWHSARIDLLTGTRTSWLLVGKNLSGSSTL